ncbi:MAG: SPOR domain-containing protein, partial [Desulfotomaculaceae bacterium]
MANVLGHREVPRAATACPGKYFPLEEVKKIQAHPVKASPPKMVGKIPVGSPVPLTEHDHDKVKTGPGLWLVQTGAFSSRERAQDYALVLQAQGIEAIV